MPTRNLTKEQLEKHEQDTKALLSAFGATGLGGAHAAIDQYGGKFNTDYDFSLGRKNNPLAKLTWMETLADPEFSGVSPEVKDAISTYGLKTGPEMQEAWRKSGIPMHWDNFQPSDLSKAGAIGAKPSSNATRIFTVTPGPDSARFARLAPEDAFEADKSGYIWGVGDKAQIQTSYADGNTHNHKRVVNSNPAVHVIDAELGSDRYRSDHLTTGQVRSSDMTGRPWGYAKNPNPAKWQINYSDNVYLPREDIRSRGVATLADMATAIREVDPNWVPSQGESFWGSRTNSADQLALAIDKLSEIKGVSPTEAVASVASPVPPLGTTTRRQGSVPLQAGIDWDNLSPDAAEKAGIGKLFVDTGGAEFFGRKGRRLIPDPEDAVGLIERTADAEKALRARNRGIGYAGAAYGLMVDPAISRALEEGRYGDAAMHAGVSGGIGWGTEKALNFAGNRLAAAGIPQLTSAVGAARAAAGPLGVAAIAAAAERSTPEIDWSKKDRRDPAVAQVINQKPSLVGQPGPDVPYWFDYPEEERRRIEALPAKTRRVKTLPIGNQALYSLNNERRYAGQELQKGNVPYLGIPINPMRWFKR